METCKIMNKVYDGNISYTKDYRYMWVKLEQ